MADDLNQLIDDYLVKSAGIAPEKVADRQLRMTELGLDSLSVVEMLFEIEDKYGFHIDDAMRYKDMTLGEVIADLQRLVAEHAAAGAGVPVAVETVNA